MVVYSDSQFFSATIGTSETSYGSINVPAGQAWKMTSVGFSGASLTSGRIAIDTLPGLNGVYGNQSTTAAVLNTENFMPLSYIIPGPATITIYGTGSSSATALAQLNYQVNARG